MTAALSTDLYQLTMAAGYWRAGLTKPATFELFVRRLPDHRSFLIAAGIDAALEYLERLSFGDDDIAWLRDLPAFAHVPRAFFDEFLPRLTFSGDVWAVPEGTPMFANEPILRVTASQPEAQVVETALLSMLGFQTSIASKAARIVAAAEGRAVIEFGARHAHGLEAALAAARAAYLAGFDGTSLVEAARRFGIPASGTMAHSWVQTFDREMDAFNEFSRSFPDSAVYLLDTYDTLTAAAALARSGLNPRMVRLDSGDALALSRQVRGILDAAGLTATRIFVTSDLDEYRIAELLRAGAPVDGFGVGTAVTTVSDAPALPIVYKLVEVERGRERAGVVKLSPGKDTWPGAKQVWRVAAGGHYVRDVVAAADEPPVADAVGLLRPVMIAGRRVAAATAALADLRRECRAAIDKLPRELMQVDAAATYPVDFSETLQARRRALELATRRLDRRDVSAPE